MAAFCESLMEFESPRSTALVDEDAIDKLPAGVTSLAIPRQGHVLTTVAEVYGRPIRRAVDLLQASFEKELGGPIEGLWNQLYASRGYRVNSYVSRAPSELAAWAVVSTWVVAVASKSVDSKSSLLDAERWFMADASFDGGLCARVSQTSIEEANAILCPISDSKALSDLLPYVLDPHGPGSRLSVRREPKTQEARSRKKSEGVYYTPEDVATFMATHALSGLRSENHPMTVFDPACGTGVFLRAALAQLAKSTSFQCLFDSACSSLFGVDIDPWALDATAFVLLHQCLRSQSTSPIAPFAAWHALRLNFANVDALRLDPSKPTEKNAPSIAKRLECKATLRSGKVPPYEDAPLAEGNIELNLLFPEIAEGPRVVIGNPPYANLGAQYDLLELRQRYTTLDASVKPSADIYPLFVEQMVRLAAPSSHGGALVLPLSIACNTGPQFVALRSLISSEPGSWRFAFFDREPHALFGEDVKTRNAIVLWKKQAADRGVCILTGPLRKWRGHERRSLFESITFTPLSVDIRLGIPKLDGYLEADALTQLLANKRTLDQAVSGIGRATLAEASRGDNRGRTVHVAATAYNFLNVFLEPGSLLNDPKLLLTEHALHAIHCPTQEVAFATFAALSGHLAFWWWHIHGDGFHVSRRTLETMPFGLALVEDESLDELVGLGKALWPLVAANPKVSVNKGRMSLGFSSGAWEDSRIRIDRILLNSAGLDPDFALVLKDCSIRVTTAQTTKNTSLRTKLA